MPNAKPLEMLDNVMLTANARYGVPVSAAQLAERYGLMTDRASDDLDYFDFYGLELDGVRFGFRTYLRSPVKKPYALVAVDPRNAPNAVELIARLAGVETTDVEVYDTDW